MDSPKLFHAIARADTPIEGESTALFPWWSIAKTVLAVAVLRLADQGKIALDDRYEDRPYTIRQLLQHTAGVNDYGGAAYRSAVAAGDPVWPVAELLARVKAERLMSKPGEAFAYSNVGFLFLRQFIEATVGLELDAALRLLVFAPLGVERARIASTADEMARTHWGNPTCYDPRWVYHGLLIGPPSDAVAFLRRAFSGGFLSAQSLAAAMDMRALGDALPGRPCTKFGYGLGLMMGEMGSAGRVYGHSGVGPDSVSALYCFPDLPGAPIVAVFGRGAVEGVAEFEALRLARA